MNQIIINKLTVNFMEENDNNQWTYLMNWNKSTFRFEACFCFWHLDCIDLWWCLFLRWAQTDTDLERLQWFSKILYQPDNFSISKSSDMITYIIATCAQLSKKSSFLKFFFLPLFGKFSNYLKHYQDFTDKQWIITFNRKRGSIWREERGSNCTNSI